MGQIRRKVCVIKLLEFPVGQFLLGCKCSVKCAIFFQEQDHLAELPATFFLQRFLQLHQQRRVIIRVDFMVLWKVVDVVDNFLIPKTEARNFSENFCTRKFLLRCGPLCRCEPLCRCAAVCRCEPLCHCAAVPL
jgi:hypothetical protein